MGNSRRILSFLAFFMLLLYVTACGTKSVMMKVMRPAEINLKQYAKIALGDFVNADGKIDQHARDLRDLFTEQLMATRRFEVIDRQSLGKILEEQKLAISGLVDEQSAPRIGKLLGVSAFIFGRITTDRFKQTLVHDEPYKDKKGKRHQWHRRKGRYDLSVFIKIIDVQTGKIIASRELRASQSAKNSGLDKIPPSIDRNTLYRKCLTDIANQFRRMIAPYEVTVKAQFLVDDKVPETGQAVAMFKSGEWESGLQLLKQAGEKPLPKEQKAKVLYDLGLAQMYLGQHDRAIENLRKAVALKPGEKRYQKALVTAKEEKKKAEELKKQLP